MLHFDTSAPLNILCLGAHADDIEIGAGGTLLRLLETNPHIRCQWVVFSASPVRTAEATASAHALLARAAERQVSVRDFRDGFFPYDGAAIKTYFEELKGTFVPDLVFTHYRDDRHQDHRVISDLTWNTWRNHLILEYEIPKYDGDMGSPNLFMHLSEQVCRQKTGLLLEHFASQRAKPWFTEDTFTALLRLRGVESNAPERYAEAFYCRKLIVRAGGEPSRL